MTRGIFISYRRSDSSGYAGRIFDRLAPNFSRERVFMDVDNIELGLDFVEVLGDRVASCDALLAIIGREWVHSRDADGKRRLDDPNDFVRIEIEAALRRNTRVIPILVGGASMPSIEELPEPLKGLARRQGLEISHNRFDSDTDILIRALRRIVEAKDGEVEDRGAQAATSPETPSASPSPAREPEASAPSPKADARIAVPLPPAAEARPAAATADSPQPPAASVAPAPAAATPLGQALKFAAVGLLLGFLFTLARVTGVWPVATGPIAVILPPDLIFPLAAALPYLRRKKRMSATIWALIGIFYALRLGTNLAAYGASMALISANSRSLIIPVRSVIATIGLCLHLVVCARLFGLRPRSWVYLLALPVAAVNIAIGIEAGAGTTFYSFTPALLAAFVAYYLAKAPDFTERAPEPRPASIETGEARGGNLFGYNRSLRFIGDIVLLLVLWLGAALLLALAANLLGFQAHTTPGVVVGIAAVIACLAYVVVRGRRVRG